MHLVVAFVFAVLTGEFSLLLHHHRCLRMFVAVSCILFASIAAHGDHGNIIVSMKSDAPCVREFEERLSRDSRLRAAVSKRGKDAVFTTWMRYVYPHLLKSEYMKHADKVVQRFNHTGHKAEFDRMLVKRTDLRVRVAKIGYNDAFAEWILPQYPNIFRAHFNTSSSQSGRLESITTLK